MISINPRSVLGYDIHVDRHALCYLSRWHKHHRNESHDPQRPQNSLNRSTLPPSCLVNIVDYSPTSCKGRLTTFMHIRSKYIWVRICTRSQFKYLNICKRRFLITLMQTVAACITVRCQLNHNYCQKTHNVKCWNSLIPLRLDEWTKLAQGWHASHKPQHNWPQPTQLCFNQCLNPVVIFQSSFSIWFHLLKSIATVFHTNTWP